VLSNQLKKPCHDGGRHLKKKPVLTVKSKKAPQIRILADEVNKLYAEGKNYLIEYSESASKNSPYCIIYFSSNNIFDPETVENFYEQLISRNKYEWYRTRIDCGTKHIFIRDVKKQHYLSGINSYLNTPEKVTDFLRAETSGYKVITLGVSSGGYAAVFFGQRLNAERIYCFNGQFLLHAEYFWRFPDIEKSSVEKYLNLKNFFTAPSKIFYFYSNKSPLDLRQFNHIKKSGVNVLCFNSRCHGIPFLKCCLPVVLNMDVRDLKILSNKRYDPWFFSIEMVGLWGTLIGSCKELQRLIREGVLMRRWSNPIKDLLVLLIG
jgi:hypothetical protein